MKVVIPGSLRLGFEAAPAYVTIGGLVVPFKNEGRFCSPKFLPFFCAVVDGKLQRFANGLPKSKVGTHPGLPFTANNLLPTF